jgi:hypothetical protein
MQALSLDPKVEALGSNLSLAMAQLETVVHLYVLNLLL